MPTPALGIGGREREGESCLECSPCHLVMTGMGGAAGYCGAAAANQRQVSSQAALHCAAAPTRRAWVHMDEAEACTCVTHAWVTPYSSMNIILAPSAADSSARFVLQRCDIPGCGEGARHAVACDVTACVVTAMIVSRSAVERVLVVLTLRKLVPCGWCQAVLVQRWSKLGFWRTALLNQAVLVGWRCGVDVGTLAKWYRAPELLLKPKPKAPAAPSTTTPDPDIASTPALTMTWALTAAELAKPTPWAQPPPLDPPSS
ncbi:glyco_trans_2-like domain-containing protein [Haematococcus lacustris]|uniref:Glyco_trans_2-like domain-containing protein n=1 Tax=Haematococcus lacustris TaxID=44745 RepID=A0A6A0A2A9_HAELA|nr:glyco_trans_2-like domain-containing protein [Haematococcus lacustris]